MSREVDRFLDRARRRHRWVEAALRGAVGLDAGSAVAIGLRVAGLPLLWGVGAAVAGGLIALATLRRSDDLALATRLDRAAGLGSALTAAVEFRGRNDPWATAQRTTVAPLLAHLDLATLLPWRGRGWGVVAATLIGGALLLPAVRPVGTTPSAQTRPATPPGAGRPTAALPAPPERRQTALGRRAVAPPHDRAAGDPLATGETAKGAERGATSPRHDGGGGGRGGGLGNVAATGPLFTETPRAEVAATGRVATTTTRGRGLLPAPTGAPPSPPSPPAGHLTPDPVADLPLARRGAVAHYFALLHPTPEVAP